MIMNTAWKGSAEQEMIHVSIRDPQVCCGGIIYADSSGVEHRIPTNTEFDMPKGIVMINCQVGIAISCDDYTPLIGGDWCIFSLRSDAIFDVTEGPGGIAN